MATETVSQVQQLQQTMEQLPPDHPMRAAIQANIDAMGANARNFATGESQ